MGNIKVILKKDIPNLGEEGDIKNVKKGYARNFLFPKKIAVDYSLSNRNIFEKQKDAIEKRKLQKKENAKELMEKLEKEKISITITSGDKGRLYGTVTSSLIVDEINKLGYTLDRKAIELKEHIKFAGTYKFTVHIYQDIYATLELTVIAKKEEKKEDTRPKRKRRFNKYSHYDDMDMSENSDNPEISENDSTEVAEDHKEESSSEEEAKTE
jgi:large subunit ribosomal protein L9